MSPIKRGDMLFHFSNIVNAFAFQYKLLKPNAYF